jgi:hypothetical protein
MGFSDELGGRLPVVNRRNRHIEHHGEPEAPVSGGKQAHLRVDRHLARIDVSTAGNDAESAFEARGISDGEELLRVRPASFAAEFPGAAELHLERAVVATPVTVAPTGDMGSCGVKDLGHHSSFRIALWTVQTI